MNLAKTFHGASGAGYLAPVVKVVRMISEQPMLTASNAWSSPQPEGYSIDDELTNW